MKISILILPTSVWIRSRGLCRPANGRLQRVRPSRSGKEGPGISARWRSVRYRDTCVPGQVAAGAVGGEMRRKPPGQGFIGMEGHPGSVAQLALLKAPGHPIERAPGIVVGERKILRFHQKVVPVTGIRARPTGVAKGQMNAFSLGGILFQPVHRPNAKKLEGGQRHEFPDIS